MDRERGDESDQQRGDGTNPEPGDAYDCEHCGGTHTVRRGKGLDVAGSSEGLDPALYVRCPDAGFVSLSDPGATVPGDGVRDSLGAGEEAGTVARETDGDVSGENDGNVAEENAGDGEDDWP